MRFMTELQIKAAWRVVASGHEQWEKSGSIETVHVEALRKVQMDLAQRLAKVEDGPAIKSTARSIRCQLRHIEQMASDLICLSEHATPCASHVEHGGS
jgi:hypothetical protein